MANDSFDKTMPWGVASIALLVKGEMAAGAGATTKMDVYESEGIRAALAMPTSKFQTA